MRITAVNKTQKGRYAIFVDGEFQFSVDIETVLQYRLATPQDTDPQALEQIRIAAEQRYQKERALSLLGYKSYTKKALAERLARDGDESIAQEVADRMEELGLIDDEAYARRCASDLFSIKGYGARRVRYELARRGVPRELADEAVCELAPEGEETQNAILALIERKYERYLGDRKGIDKTVRALARLGYDYDDIRTAIARYTDDTEYN
ncbi:MAG: regulatory protein RecX [Acetanaerobacterium sp.]